MPSLVMKRPLGETISVASSATSKPYATNSCSSTSSKGPKIQVSNLDYKVIEADLKANMIFLFSPPPSSVAALPRSLPLIRTYLRKTRTKEGSSQDDGATNEKGGQPMSMVREGEVKTAFYYPSGCVLSPLFPLC
jgi:hypothetical protein